MFDAHPRVTGPPAPHLLKTLGRAIPDRRLAAEEVTRLSKDCVELCQAHFGHWDLDSTPRQIAETATAPELTGVVGAVYTCAAREVGADFWFCKENELWAFSPRLLELYSEARLIYLHRDGRDVAASFRRSGRVGRTWAQMAGHWRREQAACESVLADAPAQTRISRLSYEALTRDTESELRRVCAELGISFDESMLRPEQTERARADAGRVQMWANLDQPVLKSNTNKYLDSATAADIRRYELVAGGTLSRLGYGLTQGGPPDDSDLASPAAALDTLRSLPLRLRVMASRPEASRLEREKVIQRIRSRWTA